MSEANRNGSAVVKIIAGSAAGAFAVFQAFNLSNMAQTDGLSGYSSYELGNYVGSAAGLVIGWTICLVLFLTANGASRPVRLFVDVVKILLGLAAGLFACVLANEVIKGTQNARPNVAAIGGCLVGAIVTGIACILLLWSAFRQRRKRGGGTPVM